MSVSRIKLFVLAMAVAATSASGVVSAQSTGGGLRIDPASIGPDPQSPVTDRFSVRGSLGGPSRIDLTETGIRYDNTLQFGSFVLADWHPYASGFRLSGGLTTNGPRFSGPAALFGAGVANGAQTTYLTSSVGSLDGRLALSKASPYVGVGWGLSPRSGSRLFFSADLGVMYQRPSASLISGCSLALRSGVCSQLHDLRVEDAEFQATDDFRFYPVISVGFGLRF